MKKVAERVIYDNYDVEALYRADALDELNMESEDNATEPTDDEIRERCELISQDMWEIESERLKNFFDYGEDTTWLLCGSAGLYDGSFAGGFTFKNFSEMFRRATKDCDYWRFWDENGHFYGKCTHHDGTNVFEIKKVSKAGANLIENWEYADRKNARYKFSERELHEKLWKKYCSLPNFAHIVYGAKKVEYEKEVTKK